MAGTEVCPVYVSSPLASTGQRTVSETQENLTSDDVSVNLDDVCQRLSGMSRPVLVIRGTSMKASYLHVRSRFLASFNQSRVLFGRCEDLEKRSGTLQSTLQLPVLQRVKNMYEHYATIKALELLQLHYQIKHYHLIQEQNEEQQTQTSFIKELFLTLQHEEDLEDLDDMYDSDSELELDDIIDGDDDEEEYEL